MKRTDGEVETGPQARGEAGTHGGAPTVRAALRWVNGYMRWVHATDKLRRAGTREWWYPRMTISVSARTLSSQPQMDSIAVWPAARRRRDGDDTRGRERHQNSSGTGAVRAPRTERGGALDGQAPPAPQNPPEPREVRSPPTSRVQVKLA